MDHLRTDAQTLTRITCGNKAALDWVQVGLDYIHEIDDLIDEDIPNQSPGASDRVCRIGAIALNLYTHPFFLANLVALRQVMMTNTLNYADSVRFEKSTVPWQRNFSDWARHGWVDVVLVVAEICGGYDVARNESLELRSLAYADHHDISGQPV